MDLQWAQLAMSCDLVIAADHVFFQLPEMPLGIVPDAGAIQRLPRRVPYNVAMEMLLIRSIARQRKIFSPIEVALPRSPKNSSRRNCGSGFRDTLNREAVGPTCLYQ